MRFEKFWRTLFFIFSFKNGFARAYRVPKIFGFRTTWNSLILRGYESYKLSRLINLCTFGEFFPIFRMSFTCMTFTIVCILHGLICLACSTPRVERSAISIAPNSCVSSTELISSSRRNIQRIVTSKWISDGTHFSRNFAKDEISILVFCVHLCIIYSVNLITHLHVQ